MIRLPSLSTARSLTRCALFFLPLALFGADSIKVGQIASLTGKEASFGQASHRGVALAVDEINDHGGILGREVEFVVEDIQSKSGESATAVKKLIARDGVVAVLGGNASTNSLEAAPICQAAHVPMIAISSTNPKVTAMGTYIFRACFIDPFQGAVLAKFSRDTLHAKRVTAIKALHPDVIAATGYYTEAALICRQARELGLDLPIIGGDGWEAPQLIYLGGQAVEGTYYSTHYSAESPAPEVQAFIKKFKARYDGETPDAVAALGYDAMMMLADAVTRAGTTNGPTLRDALAATKNFSGVTGQTTIDADRNPSKPAIIVTVKDGKTQFVSAVTP